MKFRNILLVISMMMILAACSGQNAGPTPFHTASAPVTAATSTITPSSTPARTETPTPTRTKVPNTVTPSPTRIVFRSTPSGLQNVFYDPQTFPVVTRTPSPAALCPVVDPAKKPVYKKTPDMGMIPKEREILEQLNSGVSGKAIFQDLQDQKTIGTYIEKDLTGDKVPEIIIRGDFRGPMYLFGCVDGQYQSMWKDKNASAVEAPEVVAIADMNLDGLPELVLRTPLGGFNVTLTQYDILEWNGVEFQNRITQPDFESWYGTGGAVEKKHIIMNGRDSEHADEGHAYVKDSDGNGTLELIITGGIWRGREADASGPWRWEKDIYTWDGQGFVLKSIEMEQPTYRFQVLQDADMYFYAGLYDRALDLYQQVVSNKNLDWWSYEREQRLWDLYYFYTPMDPTPTSLPVDTSDYANLAAYARFRMVYLYLVQGNRAEAEAVFNELQKLYPAGKPGSAYAEMAFYFWDTYETTDNLYSACSRAIEFAGEYKEAILRPIIDSYEHGYQRFHYKPEDICPVK